VANAWLWVTHGETVEGSIESARRTVEVSSTRSLVNLNEKITRIQKERELVYGTGPKRIPRSQGDGTAASLAALFCSREAGEAAQKLAARSENRNILSAVCSPF